MTRYYFEHRLNIVKIMCLDIQLIHQKKNNNIVDWDWVIVKIIQQNKANTGLIKLRHFNRWSIRNNMRNQFGIQPNRLHLFHIFDYSRIVNELALRLFCTAFAIQHGKFRIQHGFHGIHSPWYESEFNWKASHKRIPLFSI